MADRLAQQKMRWEENDFQQKERALIAQIQRRKELAALTGIVNEEILTTLQELGYTRETVKLLHLVPLVQVAWASGSVTPSERVLALRLGEARGIEKASLAWEQLINWLDERPSDEFFLTTLRIIRHLLEFQTVNESVAGRTDLISHCIRIATTSGDFLGIGSKISEGEQAALDQIVEELTIRNPEAVCRVVEES